MTIRHLRIFVAVCQLRSITKAAEKLFMTQPAVSLAIKELEENYGIKLFDRMSHSIRITQDGKRMLEYAAHVVSLFNEMESAMKNSDAAGELLIGSSLTIGARLMPGYVKELAERCPGVMARVSVDNSDNIVKGVLEGALDVGLVEGSVNSDSIIADGFMLDALVAVCGRDHPFASGESVSIDSFLAQPLLLRERGSGTRELFQSAVTLQNRQYSPAWESISTTAIISAVASGCGVSVLPKRLVEEHISSGKLCRVDLKNIELSRSFYFIRHKNKYISSAIRALMDIVIQTP